MAREPIPRPTQQLQGGDVGAPQRMASKYIIFSDIAKINTRSARDALPENEAAWMENLQPIAANNLVTIPAPMAPLATLSGETSMTLFSANIGAIDYVIDFTTAGAGIAINADTGAQTQFAPDGTFTKPDMTVYASERILIMDPTSGYSTWDGTLFVKGGGLSPNIQVTDGGSGYTTVPAISFSGGSGTGATAHATTDGDSVLSIVLDNPGTGYLPTDTVTVNIGGPGTGATATAITWPVTKGTTISVFSGRVWWANGRILNWTGTNGYDDITSTAAGSTKISDADLSHTITALRTLNNYLFIFGDTSVRQIGNITINATIGITLFTPLILASDIGTSFIKTIQSYNRLVLFANKQGVYAIFGASVEKISDDLDGIFQLTDFSQPLEAGLNDLRNTHCYLLLLRYRDQVKGTRSLLCMFQEKKWYLAAQGDNIKTLCTVPMGSTQQIETFASSGSDITQILQDPNTAVSWELQTALSAHGNLLQAKQALHAGVFGHAQGLVNVTMSVDSENRSLTYPLVFATQVTWINDSGGVVTWINNSSGLVTWIAAGHQLPYSYVDAYGKVLGLTFTATSAQTAIHVPALEYQDADLWGQFG
jgi:hypothetical protein